MKDELEQPVKVKEENDYEADNALETLQRAHEIKKNKHLMKRVHKKAGVRMEALTELKPPPPITSTDALREIKNKKFGPKKKKPYGVDSEPGEDLE